MLYPGGGRREYGYDPLMRITHITANDPGKNIVLDYSYSYDSMDNILSKQTGQGTYDYTYDALYRLTHVEVDIPEEENEGFSYDAVGNRLSESGVEGEWTYNENNELLTFANTEYTYDENGNATRLLLDGTVMFIYHYNAQDRLVKVDDVNENTIAEYAYDPFGRRLWKEVDGTRTYFFYADEGLVAEYDAAGTEILSYGYRPDSTWMTDPLWLKQGGEYYFYQNDHLGTPQKLVEQNGAIAWSAEYTAFGKATIEVETVVNNLRFPGQYFDTETGLHYNWFRYYAPGVGRYLRKDPIGLRGGINLFTYAHNGPLQYLDPKGLIAGIATVTGIAVFGGGISLTNIPVLSYCIINPLACAVGTLVIVGGYWIWYQFFNIECSIYEDDEIIVEGLPKKIDVDKTIATIEVEPPYYGRNRGKKVFCEAMRACCKKVPRLNKHFVKDLAKQGWCCFVFWLMCAKLKPVDMDPPDLDNL